MRRRQARAQRLPHIGFVAGVLRCVANACVTTSSGLASPPLLALTRCADGLERGLLSLPRHAVILSGESARCLLVGLACTSAQLTPSRCAPPFALQSSTLSTFQQILAACGGTAITGAACPAPPPGAALPSAPPITAVTLAWAYAVRFNPTTIAVRRETSRVACLRRRTSARSCSRFSFAVRFRASFRSTPPPSRSWPCAGLLTPPFPRPPPP